MKKLLPLLAITVLCGTVAHAQTSRTWTGSTSTAWGTASNWSPSGVPATTDHVTIVSAANAPLLSGDVTVANFSMTGGTLDLNGHQIRANGTINLTGGTVTAGRLYRPSGEVARSTV